MTFVPPERGPMAPRAPVRTVPDLDRLQRLADAAVATSEDVRWGRRRERRDTVVGGPVDVAVKGWTAHPYP